VDNAQVLMEGGMGWGSDAVESTGKTGEIVVWGGLNEWNERVASGWRNRFSG